jgi:hypothetical protein
MQMISRILPALFFLIISYSTTEAATRYWVGPVGGIYSNPSNWNTLSNGTGTSGSPISTDDIIIDRNATLFIDGSYTCNSFLITGLSRVYFTNSSGTRTLTIGGGAVSPAFRVDDGSELDVTGTSIKLTLAFGSQAAIYGTIDFSGTSSYMEHPSGTTTTIKSGAVIRYGGASGNGVASPATFFMEDQSTYEIYKNGGTFSSGTFAPGSEIYNSGATTTPAILLMTSLYGSYGIYHFESPNYSATTSAVNANVTVQDLLINNTGTGRWIFSTSPSSSYTLTIKGRLSVSPGAIFEINKAASGSQATTVKISGDVDIQGTVAATGGNTGSVLEMTGTSDVFFSAVASGIQNDVSLTVNKSPGISVIGTDSIVLPASANSKLNLISGVLDMNAYSTKLIIQNPSTTAISGGSVRSHVLGTLKRFTNQAADYSFPVSNSLDELAKAVIRPASSGATAWEVTFNTPNPYGASGLTPGQIDQVTDYYWLINRMGSSPANASAITLYYDSLANPGLTIFNQLQMVYYNSAAWVGYGSVPGTGSITNALGTNGSAAPANPITTFGIFALGGKASIVPLTIEYFSGHRSGTKNELLWKVNCTAAPSLTMILERSGDARNFAAIHEEIADAARCLQSFTFSDISPLLGKNFYRIVFRDADGRCSYSQVVLLSRTSTNIVQAAVYPNPAMGKFVTAEITSENSNRVEILLMDILGRVVYRLATNTVPGSNKIPVTIGDLPPGQYQMVILDKEGGRMVLPLIRK